MNLDSDDYTIILRDPVQESIKVRFLLSSQPDDNWKSVFDRKTSLYNYACNKSTKSIDCILTMNQMKNEITTVISEIKTTVASTNAEISAELEKVTALTSSMQAGLIVATDGLKGSDLSSFIKKKIENRATLN